MFLSLQIIVPLYCIYQSRLTPKVLTRWESLLISKDSEVKDFNNDVYAWKSANIELYPLSEEQWREEIINAAARCAREGQPVQASISSYLLETVAGMIKLVDAKRIDIYHNNVKYFIRIELGHWMRFSWYNSRWTAGGG